MEFPILIILKSIIDKRIAKRSVEIYDIFDLENSKFIYVGIIQLHLHLDLIIIIVIKDNRDAHIIPISSLLISISV